MDILLQNKLSREEWCSIEKPVSEEEKRVLLMIRDGYEDVNYRANYTQTMFGFTKLEKTPEMEYFLFDKYFHPLIKDILALKVVSFTAVTKKIKKLRSIDALRIQNIDAKIKNERKNIFEFTLMEFCATICQKIAKNKPDFILQLYTLIQWKKSTIVIIGEVKKFVDIVVDMAKQKTSSMMFISQAAQIIEKNKNLFKYEDLKLFSHQKDLFALCKIHRATPKLILYIAPTGTGKTLSPIGLCQEYRVLFVCVARHIGLALAKSAISVSKKVAFAFGCETASDIRLHYYSAVDYEINKRSGGIGKVDNSNGVEVEIMICDVQSYLCAMYYMLAFNPAEKIITYWDEPSMTLDYEEHPLHETIHRNWSENKIPNMVLSCATLPKEDEIQDVLQDFRGSFPGAVVEMITSYDCRKSIPIVNHAGYCFLPHNECATLAELHDFANYCENNKTLLRYFDLPEIVKFIGFVHVKSDGKSIVPEHYHIKDYFTDIADITMDSLKVYYLQLLKRLDVDWPEVREELLALQTKKFKTKVKANGMDLTTVDAHTLTDGPTIYLVDDVLSLARYYVEHSDISPSVLKEIMDAIQHNEAVMTHVHKMEADLELKLKKRDNTDKDSKEKKVKEVKVKDATDESAEALQYNIHQLQNNLKSIYLDSKHLPNHAQHQEIWAPEMNPKAFTPYIDSGVVKRIMKLDIDASFKILTLLGVGVLIKHQNTDYEEIVKQMAQEQHLFLILTTSDYIYGTNYQFCHGFVGEDLQNMTQQKTIQAMGRIGRNNIQQEYSIRFRNDEFIRNLFRKPLVNLEAKNMIKLFSS